MPKMVKWLEGVPEKEGHYRCKFWRLDGKTISNKVFYFRNGEWYYQEKSNLPTESKILSWTNIQPKKKKKIEDKCSCNKPDIKVMEHTIICRNCDWCRAI